MCACVSSLEWIITSVNQLWMNSHFVLEVQILKLIFKYYLLSLSLSMCQLFIWTLKCEYFRDEEKKIIAV